ncbi:hypothetical protein ACQ86N_41895 [Puia sp. P3]|uniref:hypothetical protein n=1 Tax=Puia sp. P3 TaxID=3423952 RepID=UPI003D672AB4
MWAISSVPASPDILVAGSILSWLVLQPLLASLVSPLQIALQQVKLGYLKDIHTAGGYGGWDPVSQDLCGPRLSDLPQLCPSDRRRCGGHGRLHYANKDYPYHCIFF